MRKHSKVQQSASDDSRLGRRWEYAIGNLLIASGVKSSPRQVMDGFDHEADLVISATQNSPETVLSVAHVKQRNPKEKFYRLLDELCLFKALFPDKRKVLIYAGDFLAEHGWPDILNHFFDATVFLPKVGAGDKLTQIVDSRIPFTTTFQDNQSAAAFVSTNSLNAVAKEILTAIRRPLSNARLWTQLASMTKRHRSLAIATGSGRILCDDQTQIRRPLLASICIPPRLRDALRKTSRAKLTKEDAKTQELLGTLNVSQAIVGTMAHVEAATLAFLQESMPQVDAFEKAVRDENAIYGSYLDDLHDPTRLEVAIERFESLVGKGAINEKRLARALKDCREGSFKNLPDRPTNWIMEVSLIHAGLSRNELDKRCAQTSKTFPNARNVTGRYIYGELRGTAKFTLTEFERIASQVLAGTRLLVPGDALLKYIEDRRYAIAVIQNPKPLAVSIRSAVDTAFSTWAVTHDVSEPTLLTSVYERATGEKAGRLGVVPFQAKAEKGKHRVLVRALSGFDRANINHKLKELAAKMTLIRLREIQDGGTSAVFVAALDGDWSPDDHRDLIASGYDYVVSIPKLQKTLLAIAAEAK